MLRFLFLSFFIIVFYSAYAQIIPDTTKSTIPKVREKFTKRLYARAMPLAIYTGAGYLKDRINQNIEIGRSFGMIDLGLAFGRNALRPDTAGNGTGYLEAKITLDIAQYGIFSNEMTVGAGGVINSKNYLMLELSYTIFAQFSKTFGMGIITGYYDYSGDRTDNSHNMFGLFCRFGLIHTEGGLINNIIRQNRTHNMRRH